MAKYIDFEVSGKILLPCAGTRAVVSCNSDYRLRFTFSSDWGDFPDKTVLLSDKKVFYSIPLSSGATECALPRIDKPRVFDIGITASDGDGATVTTAPLTLTVLPSIRSKADGNIEASETASDELARLSEALEAAQSAVEGISEATEAARSAALRANEAADSVSVEKEEAAYAAARANTAANAAEGAIITNAQINSAGDLILTRSDGGEHDCGRARGEAGTVISGDEPTDESHPVWLCPDGEFEGIYELPGVSSADAGKVLRVSAAGEWEAADGDGDSKPFVVTVTYGDDGTLTADKTHAEIVEAYAAGAQINTKIVNYPGVIAPSILPLYVNNSDAVFIFSGSGVLDGRAMAMTAQDFNGSWSVSLTELATPDDIPSGGTDTSLGVTGAEVGQIIKIKAVDENGIPTEWEAADAASGEDWEFINEISTNEWISSVTINQDSNGNPFSLKKMRIFMTLPKTTNEAGEEQSNPGYAHYKVNDRNPAWQSPAGYWESGLFLWTIEAFGDYYIVSCWKDGANSSTLHHIDVFHDAGYFESITSFTWKLFNANYGWGSTNFKVYGVKA
ncbi:MAG TPA: hypothetical protein DEW22_00670 [Clostridiales bacterium]|nr:hypothetical protein [Clostridiales bacterium]